VPSLAAPSGQGLTPTNGGCLDLASLSMNLAMTRWTRLRRARQSRVCACENFTVDSVLHPRVLVLNGKYGSGLGKGGAGASGAACS
jgi:hypothetical protein